MDRDKPKNIVLIMADQMSAAHLHCYGSPVPATPTLDALAAGGTMFTRCYASSPVCTPNRACLLTGRSPEVHGMVSNNFVLPPDIPTYAHVLGHHGYHVAGFGKFHQTPMPWHHPNDYSHLGFDETLITEDPKWGPYVEWIRLEHPEHFDTALAMAWGEPRDFPEGVEDEYDLERVKKAREEIMKPLRSQNVWPCIYPSPLPAELHQTTWITDVSIDSIKQHRRQRKEQPFFCHISYVDPHDPYDPPAPYNTLFSPDTMPEPIPATWVNQKHTVLEKARSWIGFNAIADNVAEIKRWRALYYGSVRFIDDQIARIVATLKEEGIYDETVILFTTDHGEMLGDHQLLCKGRPHYDAGIRVPLIVAGGGVAPLKSDRLTCTMDFFPAFCDWAQIPEEVRPPIEGRSFAPICQGESEANPWPSVRVAMAEVESVVGQDGWRLTLFHDESSPNHLFNLYDDPTEQTNLYNQPGVITKQVDLLEALSWHTNHCRVQPHFRNLPIRGKHRFRPGGVGGGQMGIPIPLYGEGLSAPRWTHTG